SQDQRAWSPDAMNPQHPSVLGRPRPPRLLAAPKLRARARLRLSLRALRGRPHATRYEPRDEAVTPRAQGRPLPRRAQVAESWRRGDGGIPARHPGTTLGRGGGTRRPRGGRAWRGVGTTCESRV